MSKFRELLDSIYLNDEGKPGSFGSAKKSFYFAHKQNAAITRNDVKRYLETIQGFSRHARILRKFPKRMFLNVSGPYET